MRFSATFALHVAREVALHTALGFALAMPIVVVPNAAGRLRELVGVPVGEQLAMLGLMAPLLTAYALPIAFVFGAWMALGRLSDELELDAAGASGIGLGTLLVPIATLGVLVAGATAYLMIEIEPGAKRELGRRSLELAARGQLVEAGRFMGVGPRVVFARDRRDDEFEGVMIADDSRGDRSYRAFAERGNFSFDPASGRVTLSLENGDLRVDPEPSDTFDSYRISFARFEARFPTELGRVSTRRPTDQLDWSELRAAVARLRAGEPRAELRYRSPRFYETRIQRLCALPLAPLLFGVIAAALGVAGRLRGRAWGLFLGLAAFAVYYGWFFVAQDQALLGTWPVIPAIWSANTALGLVAGGLVWSTRRPR